MSKFSVAIVGSRSCGTEEDYLALLDFMLGFGAGRIVSGGARGADTLARRFAKDFSLELKEYIPDWDKYGKAAGFRRNRDIVSDCDFVVALWDGKSRGTNNTIVICLELARPFHIIGRSAVL